LSSWTSHASRHATSLAATATEEEETGEKDGWEDEGLSEVAQATGFLSWQDSDINL
jgi:hypothetical protein